MDIAQFQPVDRISNLPDNVTDSILMHLTLRDAAKTSILSKQWRYKWVKLPQLKFDENLWQEYEGNQESARMKFLLILYKVLLHHQGPIFKLSFFIPKLKNCSEIDDLIHILWKKSVEEFTFIIKSGEEYTLPSSLFMCSQLKHLKLSSCLINPPPPSFKGFNRLIKLELLNVTIDADVLGSLISSCPLLEKLWLDVSNKFGHLEIDAPMLKHFKLICFTTLSFCFKKSPLLEIMVVASQTIWVVDNIMEDGNCNFNRFFDSLPGLQKLSMNYAFIKNLAAGQVQSRLPATLVHLKILRLFYICINLLDELSCILCLIRSSPNLEELKVEILESANADASQILDLLKLQDYSDVNLNRLQKVELDYISGTVAEMAVIKLLLEKSPELKRMVILPMDKAVADKGLRILKQLNKFGRASPIAKVDYVDFEDEDEDEYQVEDEDEDEHF